MPVTDAQQQQLEAMQSRIVSHIKIKALNMAQVEFVDLLRKITQTIQRQVVAASRRRQPVGSGPSLPLIRAMKGKSQIPNLKQISKRKIRKRRKQRQPF